ncbi:WXG100 family type VII secretion target [Nonomuraea sp. NPDC050153]|uniref:WXG100 family type VII secretion target n=1 Tax=Nonomuraea sp. NPDC050153 TaxID=3364359 RepID=UPI00379E1CBA
MAENLTSDHELRPYGNVPFSVNDDGRSVAEITRLFTRLDPEAIASTAESYLAAAAKLTALQDTLVSQAAVMAQIWEGTSSVESQQSLRTLHATIRELAAKFKAVGLPLQALGKRLQQHQDFIQDKNGSWSVDNWMTWDDDLPGLYRTMNGGYEWGSQNELAGQHLRLLNNDLLEIYEQLPTYVHKVVPDLQLPTPAGPDLKIDPDSDDYQIDPNLINPPGGDLDGPGVDDTGTPSFVKSDMPSLPNGALSPDGTSSNGTYTGSDADPTGTGADGRFPDSAYPTGSMPGDGNVNDGSSSTPSPVNMKSGTPDPDLTTNAGMPDTSSVKPSDARTTLEDFQRPTGWDPSIPVTTPNGSYPYAATGNGTGPGTGSGGNAMSGPGITPLNPRSASAIGSGMPLMPMAGAGTGATESEDREKTTWLLEDDDVWGADADDAVSEQIG